MLNLKWSESDDGLNILCLGAHCDDIEIGCGGTVLKLIEEQKISQITWIIFTSNEKRKQEAHSSAEEFLKNIDNKDIKILDYKDGYLPSLWSEVKNTFESIKQEVNPDIIFTHYRNDLHQDHRVVSELTWNTFRNHIIFEYEITKYDGDLGSPNVFTPLDQAIINRKGEILMRSFQSQKNKHWFDKSTIKAVMRIRGVECASPSHYAEAFYCRKMIM